MKVSLSTVFLVLLVLVPAAALAQNNPPVVITSITPASGPIGGGTEVTITGSGFAAQIVCILPCPPRVRFGNSEVEVKSETDTRLTVLTPPHAQGVVDVTVIIADGRTATRRNGFAYGNSAQAGYESILLPIYLDGRVNGANGSQWQTDFWLRNANTTTATLAPWECPAGQTCPAVFPLTRTLAAGETIHNLPAFFRAPTANVGRMLYVTRGAGDDLEMQLRFADVSRSTLNAGTEMPVVREDEFFTSSTSLLNIPFETRFRLMLRIYETALTESRFRVNLYAQETGTNSTPDFGFDVTATTSETGEFRLQPAYGQYSVEELLQLRRAWPAVIRLEIVPQTPGSRYWAFLSATNNETQLVTLVTPQ